MKDKRNRNGAVGKSSSEQHFVNPSPLPLSCEISGALHLVQPCTGWQAGRQADANFKILKISCRLKYPSFYFV